MIDSLSARWRGTRRQSVEWNWKTRRVDVVVEGEVYGICQGGVTKESRGFLVREWP